MVGFEDDVLIDFVFTQLEEAGAVSLANWKLRVPVCHFIYMMFQPLPHGFPLLLSPFLVFFPAVLFFQQDLDARKMQINLTGFLNAKNAREFMAKLWKHLVSASNSKLGISDELVKEKAREIQQQEVQCFHPSLRFATTACHCLFAPLTCRGFVLAVASQAERQRVAAGIREADRRSQPVGGVGECVSEGQGRNLWKGREGGGSVSERTT